MSGHTDLRVGVRTICNLVRRTNNGQCCYVNIVFMWTRQHVLAKTIQVHYTCSSDRERKANNNSKYMQIYKSSALTLINSLFNNNNV